MRRLLALALISSCCGALAADFPTKPIRLLVGFSPGGPNDTQARLLGQRLSSNVGQPVVVDNRPGADGIIAGELLVRASPDGHTLMLASAGHAISHNFHRSMPYHPVTDFQPIVMISTSPFVLVTNPSLKAASVAELIALARSRPDNLIYGSAGSGSSLHLATALFSTMAGISMVHVPYKGGAPATTALLSGQVQLIFNNVVSSMPHVRSGRLRALGVTSAKRSSAFPNTPAIAETVPGYEVLAWYGMLAPAKLPPALTQELNAQFVKVLADRDIQAKLQASGLEVVASTPERLGEHIRSEYAKWIKVVRDLKIQRN